MPMLYNSEILCNFATANQKFADIIKKAFIDACFGTSKSGKFLYPKQDSNERPLVCI